MKHALRKQTRSAPTPAAASAAIQRRLLDQDWWAAAFAVGLYRATPAEPSTDVLLADLFARGARVAVPVAKGTGYRWGWVETATRWRKGGFGILEPEQAPPASPSSLRVILVPGVAFDARGGRLGHGHGHFDRLLSQTGALLVGLCMEQRLVEAVPLEPHDIPMDAVVTEKRMLFAPAAAAKLERLIG